MRSKSSRPDGAARRLLRLLPLLGTLFTTGNAGAGAIDLQCALQGGQADCPPPITGPWGCVAAVAPTVGSSPQCVAGGTCRTPQTAIDAMNSNWASMPNQECSDIEPKSCAYEPVFTWHLGEVQWEEYGYDAWLDCPTRPNFLWAACDAGQGVAAKCGRDVNCPPDSQEIPGGPCKRVRKDVCPAGNPIYCAGGRKSQVETDLAAVSPGGLEFTRYYSSSGFYESPPTTGRNVFSATWRHTYQRALVVQSSGPPLNIHLAYVVRPDGDYRYFKLVNGVWTGRKDKWEQLEEITDQGVRIGWQYLNAQDETETYDANGVLLSIATRAGLTTTLTYSDANTPGNVAPAPNLLIRVTDAFGRSLNLRYVDATHTGGYTPRRIEMTDSGGNLTTYEFNGSDKLARVIRPDGKVRQYLYNETALTSYPAAACELLTGIIDENNQRYASYKYDVWGRAIDEWHGSSQANRLSVVYSGSFTDESSTAIVTDALGAITKRRFVGANGILRDAGTDRCSTIACNDSNPQRTQKFYDTDGNLVQSSDFRGTVTRYEHNQRGQQLVMKENYIQPTMGCPSGTSFYSATYNTGCVGGTCWSLSPFTGSSSGTPYGFPNWHYSCLVPNGPGSYTRSTETDWHATFKAPVERRLRNASGVLEAKTQWTYNSRGQITARCEIAPEDATAMGYSCSASNAPPSGAKVRRWTYTYCEAADVAVSNSTCPIVGLAKTVNGPRSVNDSGMNGLDDVTSYAYYPTSEESGCGMLAGPCHRKGDLHTITNALGHVTENISYDRSGSVLRSRDPNGTLTDMTYNARGLLTSRTIRALASGASNIDDAATNFIYDDVRQGTRVTQPDGSYFGYSYDDAHRLTDIFDNLGKRLHYTLDPSGNQIKEEAFDESYSPATPSAGLKRALSRQYNAMNLVIRQLNAANTPLFDSTPYDSATLTDGYDAEGNAVQFKNGSNVQTQQTYDALNRLTKIIRDYSGTNIETSNTTIEYTYDSRDNLRSVKDPDNLSTTYTYDGIGDLSDLYSPDTGHTGYIYDLSGNRKKQTDNRGIITNYTYDALNRLTGISYPTSSLNIEFHYDQYNVTTACESSYPLGKMTRMTDATGSTTYCYDRRGNITRKNQITAGTSIAVAYAYNKANRLTIITYPSGGTANCSRNSSGQIVGLTWKADANASPISVISNITYYPFGPINTLTFGDGRTLTKIYDSNYLIDKIVSSATNGLALDFSTDVMGNIVGVSNSLEKIHPDRQYLYDKLNRLVRVSDNTGASLEEYGPSPLK